MKEPIRDRNRLEHILQAIDRLQRYAGGLSKEELEQDVMRYYGIVKNIEIIGEAARMLTDEFKAALIWRWPGAASQICAIFLCMSISK